MNCSLSRLVDLLVWGLCAVFLYVFTTHLGLAATPAALPAPSAAADVWREECGSCHLAFPARLLPAAAWQQLLTRLDRHFGADAALSDGRAAIIGQYLQAHAPSGAPPAGSELPRITRSAWFEREHDEVPAEVWRRPAVRSRGNCAACHAGAEQGVFSERQIRIPK